MTDKVYFGRETGRTAHPGVQNIPKLGRFIFDEPDEGKRLSELTRKTSTVLVRRLIEQEEERPMLGQACWPGTKRTKRAAG